MISKSCANNGSGAAPGEETKREVLVFSTDYPPFTGGIATYSYEVARNMPECWEVTVLAPWMRGCGKFDKAQAFKTIRIPDLWGFREIVFCLCLIRHIIRRGPVCIFNAIWFPCGMLSFLVTRFFRAPYFIAAFASEMLDDNTSLRRRFKKSLSWLKHLSFRYADMVFPASDYTRKKLLEMGVSPERLTVLHPGVDINMFRPGIDPARVRERYGLGDNKVLLTVARLDPHKGVDMVIRSLPIVRERFPNTIYLVIGVGPYEDKLRKMADELGVSANVIFAGRFVFGELTEFYNACDIFVMPSREVPGRTDMIEGFGISYIEAAACAKPVIGGRSGGVADAVLHGKTGLLVDPINVEKLAGAIVRLLDDENLSRALGSAGRRRVEEELNWPIVARKLTEYMETAALQGSSDVF